MKKILNRLIVSLMIVGGLTGSLQAMHQVNISGATLFAGFFTAPASTNDYIDVDGDGLYGFFGYSPYVDQLAATYVSGAGWDPYWAVLYRGVGSGNGLSDLVNWHNTDPVFFSDLTVPADYGYINRIAWANLGVLQPIADPCLPGGCPVDPNNIDIAVMDVPTTWFVYNGSSTEANWSKKPTQAGYGKNPLKVWGNTQSNQLKSLGNLNTNTTSPDAQTVFDTEIAWVPIAIIANQGVGLPSGNINAEQVQYLNITGRMPNGENLAAVTRDSGSGTRNGSMNTLGIDPSWGRGDNRNNKFDVEAETKLGPNHKYSNCGGSGIMEKAVETKRLGIGYTGLCGSSRARGDVYGGKYEVCSIKNIGGSVYVRPTLDNILNNSDANSGWRIGGNETFATVGSPESGAAYPMSNPHAAAYINNISESIADFITSPGQDSSFNMPGEYMAFSYFLVAGIDQVPNPLDPASFISNSRLNQALQDFVAASQHELVTSPIPAFGSIKPSGMAPTREVLTGGETYSDGSTSTYIDNGGNVIASGTTLSERNKVAGDFNYAGSEKHKRNMNDIAKLVEAVKNPRAFEAAVNHGGYYGTQAGDYVIPEIIGDFDGDGNFAAADVRYFADGLAVNTLSGQLNRSEGFAKVDQADATTGGSGNYFNTILATGRIYEPNSGWSKADIAGDANATPGANPIADGVIDANDIDYLRFVLHKGIKAQSLDTALDMSCNLLDWQNPDDAAWMDLSCDINGDLLVSEADVYILIYQILDTELGDVNLDGVVNTADFDIITANLDTQGGWAMGDVNGDGEITDLDLQIAQNPGENYDADINHDGSVNMVDFAVLADQWLR